MTIDYRPIEHPKPIGQWTLPKTPPFLVTQDYGLLLRDLERYVEGEITGRSYLIAGHRGAGKTALITRAVEDLRTQRLQASEQSQGVGDRQPLRRPLLVRLYGPSLLEPLALTPAEQIRAARSARLSAKQAAEAGGPEAPLGPGPDTAASQAALVQITIALYRALAGETAEAFAAHARERVFQTGDRGLGREEAHELAAQLALELDTATSPALLRTYWHRLGRLGLGVFWPSRADETLRDRGLFDQAVREIVALATAGQAFEVCSGAVTYKVTDNRGASASSEVKASGAANLKDLVGRLGALAAGGVTTASLWPHEKTPAVGLGVIVWLLGTATLNWSGSRKRSQDRSSEYTFLRDRSLQTLDRDLPLVISRIRDAGLAPVFMVDELDKVDDAPAKIGDLIRRLKHIVSDYGFFCFLTDRDYFDYVDQLVRNRPFPREHSYFSRRRLVAYPPSAFEGFLRGQLRASDEANVLERVALERYIYSSAHASQLNFANLMRATDVNVAADGDLSAQLLAASGQIDIQLATNVQLAIDEVMADAELSRRMERDAGFAQLAHDALYAVSRAWDDDRGEFDGSETALVAQLRARLSSANAAEVQIPQADVRLLLEKLGTLLEYLCDFPLLVTRLAARTDDRKQRADLVVATFGGLLRAKPGETDVYEFNFDSCGRDLRPDRSPLRRREAERLADLIRAFNEIMAALQVAIPDLAGAGLLPNSITAEALAAAEPLLSSWTEASGPSREVIQAAAAARGLQSALRTEGERLAVGLMFAQRLATAAGGRRLSDGLAALARYAILGQPGVPWPPAEPYSHEFPAADATGHDGNALRAWLARYQSALQPRAQRPQRSPAANRWAPWHSRLMAWFETGAAVNSVGYDELVAATQGLAPVALLQVNLDRVTPLEWSKVALAAMPRRQAPAPRWALVAALRALGFRSEFLQRLARAPDPLHGALAREDIAAATAIAAQAVGVPDNFLAVLDAQRAGTAFELEPRGGILYVSHSEMAANRLHLDWLQTMEAFRAVLYHDDEEVRPSPA